MEWVSWFPACTVGSVRYYNPRILLGDIIYHLHLRKLTWNLKMNPWKRKFLLKTISFRFHVSFRWCTTYEGNVRNSVIDDSSAKLTKPLSSPTFPLEVTFPARGSRSTSTHQPPPKKVTNLQFIAMVFLGDIVFGGFTTFSHPKENSIGSIGWNGICIYTYCTWKPIKINKM